VVVVVLRWMWGLMVCFFGLVSSVSPSRFDGDVEVKTSDSGAAVSTGTKFVLNKCVSDVQPPVFTRVTGTARGKGGGSGVCSGVCSSGD
jgi:hypothetical protein